MQWVSIADLQARFDPRVRLAYENQHLKRCIAQAQIDQADRHHRERLQVENMKIHADREKTKELVAQGDRHHNERMQLENMKLDAKMKAEEIQARATIEKEKIAGKNALDLADRNYINALSLANRNHVLGQLTQGSQLIDSMILSQLKQEEDWSNTIADTMRQLFVSEADTIKQTRLKEIDHQHKIESMTLEYNLRFTEMFLQNEIQNSRVSYDKTCEVIFKLVERVSGLGDKYVNQDDITSWINEAMGQAYQ